MKQGAKSSKFGSGTVRDTGKGHTAYSTGSQRDSREGKGRYDLISPIALRRLAVLLEAGAIKYERRNWEKGQPLEDFFDSAARHLYTWLGKVTSGEPMDEDHLAAVMWNIHCLIHCEEKIAAGKLPKELLGGLPDYLGSAAE